MNKLTAMSKLANAYWYIRDVYGNGGSAATLEDKFNYLRRSLRMVDLTPQPKCSEGLNPKGPTFF